MMAKIWSMGAVVLLACAFSLIFVVRRILQIPIAGSIPLFLVGATLNIFATTSLGIFLGTVARSMQQFGIIVILVLIPLDVLSGGMTPQDSMPQIHPVADDRGADHAFRQFLPGYPLSWRRTGHCMAGVLASAGPRRRLLWFERVVFPQSHDENGVSVRSHQTPGPRLDHTNTDVGGRLVEFLRPAAARQRKN